MRTVLAAAAAGALLLGSAGGAMATAKDKPAPQSTVKLQSVSIKGHKTIDVVTTTPATPITVNLRATIWDPQNANKDAATVALTLAAYTKKVNGEIVPGITSILVPMTFSQSKSTKKSDRFEGSVVLSPDSIRELQGYLGKDQKTYLCISTATVSPTVAKYSMQVQKRLGVKDPAGTKLVKKPVRDCVKVIDSTP